jgi:pspC domain
VDLGALHPQLAHLDRTAEGVSPGLCRAISARFQIDPLLVRILFILGSALSGMGVIAYGWGVLLTPRTGRQAPIHKLLPAFSSWSLRTQWTIIVLSSALVVAAIAQVVSMSPAMLLLVFALVLYRRRRGPRRRPAPSAAPLDTQKDLATEADPQLPVVDLYAPEAPEPPPEKTKISWVGTGVVLFVTYLATAISIELTANPMLVAATALGAGGIVILGWGLLARSRRLPVALLLLALLASTTMASLTNGMTEKNTVSSIGKMITYAYIACEDPVLDLRELPEDKTIVHVQTIMSSRMRIILPKKPVRHELLGLGSNISWPEGDAPRDEASSSQEIKLTIDGFLSDIKVEYPS